MDSAVLEEQLAKYQELRAAEGRSAELDARIEALDRERERYRIHGFGVDVLLSSGTYSFSPSATFDAVVDTLRSREAHLADSFFHFVCCQLPTTDAEADSDLVHIMNDEHFDRMKRAYEVAGYSALPVCVHQPLTQQRETAQHQLRTVSGLVAEAPADKLTRVSELLQQAEELLRATPTTLTELKSHEVIVIGNDPTENATSILRAAHATHLYRSGLKSAFGINEAEVMELMESWVPASSDVALTRKQDGGLQNDPLRRDSIKLIRHIVNLASKRTPSQTYARVLGCGKLFDLMMQFALDPKTIHKNMFDPASGKEVKRFQPGGDLHGYNLKFNPSLKTAMASVQMLDECSSGKNIRLVHFTRGDQIVASCYIAVVRHPGSAKRSATNASLFDTARLWRDLMAGVTYMDTMTVKLEYLDAVDGEEGSEEGSEEDSDFA